jgi:predicted amidohydrolase
MDGSLRLLAEAHRRGCHFACLPECFLSGYGAPDALRAGAIDSGGKAFRGWVKQTALGDMVSIVGFVERRGKHFHNSAAIVQHGKLLGIYRKSVPGSRHEKALMTYISRFPIFCAHGITFGVIICVEASMPEPCLLLASRGARVIFEPHFSFIPRELVHAHQTRVRNNHVARAVENQIWLVRSNIVADPGDAMGGEAGLGYGDSLIVDPLGVPRAEAGLFTTGWITADAPAALLREKRKPRVPRSVPAATRKLVARLYR